MEECGSSSHDMGESSSNITIPSSEELKAKRKEYFSKRDTTKICLYEQFQRWRSVKEELNIKTDKQLAEILLDNFTKNVSDNPVCLREAETQTENIDATAAEMSTQLSPVMASPVLTSTPAGINLIPESNLSTPRSRDARKRRRLSLDTDSDDGNRIETTQTINSLRLQSLHDDETLSAFESDESEFGDNSLTLPESHRVQDDDVEKASLEEEVLDTRIDGHDDNGDDDVHDDNNPQRSTESLVCHISYVDVPQIEFCFASTTMILDLLKKVHGPTCTKSGCSRQINFRKSFVGTCLVVNWACSAGHHGGRWAAQPTCEGVRAGNLLLGSAIALSGNSYTKMGFLCKIMNLQYFSRNLYNQYQNLYIAPAVNDYWEQLKSGCWTDRDDMDVILSSDGRNDSPGHSAQYCTYTFAEMESKCILDIIIVDVREVEGRKSPNMERVGFERGLDKLLKSKMKVKEVVTDGHLEIGALMKNAIKYKDIVHQRDVWHGAKIIGKKVVAAANEKGNEDLSFWIAAVRNHFWYCSRKCGGNVDNLKDLWIGILHHIVNEHEWILKDGIGEGTCGHAALTEEERTKPWLSKNSSAHKSLRNIVLKKRLLNEMHYYTNFRHTGFLESFHNHLLMYCPKRHSYSFVGYKLRNHLAAIDFNKHRERQVAKTADGKTRYRYHFSKRTKMWCPVLVLEPKEYNYIPELVMAIFEKRKTTPGHVTQKLSLAPDDPRNIDKNIAAVPKPPMEELLQRHQSRFSDSTQ